jgi:hypothetical protein
MCAPQGGHTGPPLHIDVLIRITDIPLNNLFDEAALVFYYRGNTGKEVIVNI